MLVTLLRGVVRGLPINRVWPRIRIPDSTTPEPPTIETVTGTAEVSSDIDMETVDSDSDGPEGG